MCAESLLKEIEKCRKEMVELASASSLSNQRVIETSMKLDHLLNTYYHFIASKTYAS